MAEKEIYVAIGFIIIWVVLSIYASIRAKRYFTANKKRLAINIVMIWLMPYLWALLIIMITRKAKLRKKDGYKYHESGYSNYTRWGG